MTLKEREEAQQTEIGLLWAVQRANFNTEFRDTVRMVGPSLPTALIPVSLSASLIA